MADVITRLRLESSEYDSKLKRAVGQMQAMEKEVRRTGATFAVADKDELAFVQSLGTMQTQANSAKGQIAELKNAFTELSVQYQRMTDEEKKSPIGQAMQGSLSQLKGRIGELNGQLATAQGDMGDMGSVLQDLAGKFGLPVGTMGKMSGVLTEISSKGFPAVASSAATAGRAIITSLGPIGAIVAAIVIAIKQLVDAFKRNEDAMTAVQKIAAPFKAVWQSIQRLFDDIVRIFVNVYNSLEKAAGGFYGFKIALSPVAALIASVRAGLAILGTVLTDIAKGVAFVAGKVRTAMQGSTVGKFFKNITDTIKGFFTTLTTWVDKVSNSKLGKALGLDGLAAQLREIVNAQNELTASNKKIAESENELNKLRRRNNEQTALDERRIAQLRAEASDKDQYTASERIRKLEEAAALEEGIMKRNVIEKQKELDLIRLKNSLTQSGTEDLNAESAAQVALTQAGTEYYNRMRTLQRQLQAAKREEAADTGTTTTTTTPEASNDPAAGSIAAQEKLVQELTAKWKGATDETRDGYKAELDAAKAVLDEMVGKTQHVGNAVKTASDIWSEHTTKIAEVEARLNEFKEMVADTSLTDAQRDWAAGMAEQYQSELDKMKGSTEDAVDEITSELADIPSSFEMFKSGVGAVGSLVGSLDNLKKVGDDLTKVFSGEMDAWDSLMTILNSGLSILQTVISVTEAINTLTEIGTALKAAHAAAATSEATAVVSAAGTEVAAEGAVAAASGTATAAKAGEAAAGAGSAVSAIPIVGPILAVAAIGAVLAAVLSAVNKSKSANSYSTGGMVGGNSPSGDNVVAWLNSGEGVLTANGVSNAKTLAEGSSLPNNLHLSTEISGTNLRVVLDNDNRSKGGSRGAYSRIK